MPKNKATGKRYHKKMKNDPHYKDMRRLACIAWAKRNPDKKTMSRHNWYENNKHRYNLGRTQMFQRYRDQLFEVLGGAKCIRCGFSDKRALHFDHIDGGGTAEFRKKKDYSYYRKYIDQPELARKTFQVLCANDNAIKRTERYKAPLRNCIIR